MTGTLRCYKCAKPVSGPPGWMRCPNCNARIKMPTQERVEAFVGEGNP